MRETNIQRQRNKFGFCSLNANNVGIHTESSHLPTQCLWSWDSSSGLQGPMGLRSHCLLSSTHTVLLPRPLVLYPQQLSSIGMKYGRLRCFHSSEESLRRWLPTLLLLSSGAIMSWCLHHLHLWAPSSKHRSIVMPSKQLKHCLSLQLPRAVCFILYPEGKFTLEYILFKSQPLWCSKIH